MYDRDGRVVMVNGAFERMWGVDRAGIPADYSVLADLQFEQLGVLPLVRRAFAGEALVTPPLRYDITRVAGGRGQVAWTQGHFFPLRDERGQVTHVVHTHVDLTARMEAERALADRNDAYEEQVEEAQSLLEELEHSNEQLQDSLAHAEELRLEAEEARQRITTMLDTLTDAVSSYDHEWRFAYLNPTARQTLVALGKDPDQALGRVVWDEVPSVLGTRFETETKRAAAEQAIVEYEEHLPDLDRWYETRILPTRDGVTIFARDITERRRAAERLRTSEARHRALVEGTTLMVWNTDANGLIEDMPFWRALTGQTRDEVRGNGWQAAIHPGDRDRVAELWGRAYALRAMYEAEYRLRLSDGTYRWFRARGVPVVVDGALREWIGVFEDTDEQHRARVAAQFLERASLALSGILAVEDALRTVARLAVEPVAADAEPFADGVAIDLVAPGGGFTRVAIESGDPAKHALVEAIEREYPTQPDAPAGYAHVIRTGVPELHAELHESVLPRLARDERHLELLRALDMSSSIIVPLRARGETRGAITLVLCGGGRRPYDAHGLAVAEELARRAGIALDNAFRFEAEQRAGERARQLQRLAAALVDATTLREVCEAVFAQGLAAVEADAGSVAVLHHLPAGAEFEIVHTEGYPEPIRARFGRFPLRPGRPLSDAVLTRQPVLIRSGAEWRARYPEMAAATTEMGYEAMALVPVMSADRAVAGITFSFRNARDFDDASRTFLATIGEQCGLAMERAHAFEREREARAAAEEANRAKSDFLARMSHELRTPLNAIDGYAQLLEMGVRGELTPEQRADVGRIRRSQKHLLSLINDVLSFARLESGHVEFDLRPLPLAGILGGLEDLVAPLLREKGLRYRFEAPAPELLVLADEDKLRQILLNLLGNAVKFTDRGEVSLACEGGAASVAIRVRDTGHGIPPDKLEAIFEPFIQVDGGLRRTSQGSGLGLAIARDLARRMKGDITVESTMGGGSIFTVVLPCP